MMTVVTTITLEPEATGEWDSLIRERFRSAQSRAGWISGQVLARTDSPTTRVIVGTWQSREDWEAWHDDPAFQATRGRLDELPAEDHVTVWYDILEDARAVG